MLSAQLEALRKARGYHYSDLVEMTGLCTQAVVAVHRGRGMTDSLNKIAKAYYHYVVIPGQRPDVPLGAQLRAHRLANGISLRSASESSGVAVKTIERIERGEVCYVGVVVAYTEAIATTLTLIDQGEYEYRRTRAELADWESSRTLPADVWLYDDALTVHMQRRVDRADRWRGRHV
ncbi:MAG: helix-turn-helix transcriptional regulator [Hyphomicrobiaceae bacterium]|nr:helix-turn-helix transcriptional regulator [Hyphomicrobiaceae bacterium]